MALLDELIEAVARCADLQPHQAERAVAGTLRFLGARLPSPLFGELKARLNAASGQVRDDLQRHAGEDVDGGKGGEGNTRQRQ